MRILVRNGGARASRATGLASIALVVLVGSVACGGKAVSSPHQQPPSAQNSLANDGITVAGGPVSGYVAAFDEAVSAPANTQLVTLSKVVRLSPSGPLATPATITIPLESLAPANDTVVVQTSESAAGPWTYLAFRLSSDRNSVTFTTTHFSCSVSLDST